MQGAGDFRKGHARPFRRKLIGYAQRASRGVNTPDELEEPEHNAAWAVRVVCDHYGMPEWELPDELTEDRLMGEAERIDVMREIRQLEETNGI